MHQKIVSFQYFKESKKKEDKRACLLSCKIKDYDTNIFKPLAFTFNVQSSFSKKTKSVDDNKSLTINSNKKKDNDNAYQQIFTNYFSFMIEEA